MNDNLMTMIDIMVNENQELVTDPPQFQKQESGDFSCSYHSF